MSSIGLGLNLSANVGIGFPPSINVTGAVGGIANIGLGTVSNPAGQIFATRALPNSRFSYYTLAICDPNSQQPVETYIFPLSPSSVVKEFSAMTNFYDVASQPSQNDNGVTRIVDVFGNSPVTYMLRGTTGWQYHSTDGYAFTGVDSILLLQSALNSFAQRNKQQINSGASNLYTLEFYDYFTGDYWQVVPVGPQRIEQTSQRPLLFEYTLRLVGVKDLSAGPSVQPPDDLAANLVGGATTSLGNTLTDTLTSALSNYAQNTLGIF